MPRSQLPQSVEYVQFFSTLAAGAIVSWIVWEMVKAPRAYNEANATDPLVVSSNEWFRLLIENLPVIFLAIAVMGSIAWTVYRSNFT